MQVACEIGMADLYLECRISKARRMGKQRAKGIVAQVEIETAGISANTLPPAAQKLVQWHSCLLCGKVPEGDLNGFIKR